MADCMDKELLRIATLPYCPLASSPGQEAHRRCSIIMGQHGAVFRLMGSLGAKSN